MAIPSERLREIYYDQGLKGRRPEDLIPRRRKNGSDRIVRSPDRKKGDKIQVVHFPVDDLEELKGEGKTIFGSKKNEPFVVNSQSSQILEPIPSGRKNYNPPERRPRRNLGKTPKYKTDREAPPYREEKMNF